METILKAIAFIFVADFYLYWQHRCLHWFCPRLHSRHHTWKFKTVFHPFEQIVNWAIFPIGWAVGFTTAEMLPVLVWSIIFVFISHREKKARIKRYIFMTAKAHETHHDLPLKNFGVLLTLWDRLARTYE